MRSCVKKPIKILMGNCFVKSNVVMLVMTIFALQVTYAQGSSEPPMPPGGLKVIPLSPRYDDTTASRMLEHSAQNGHCDMYDNCVNYSKKKSKDLIYYSILMADKYDCPYACLNTYKSIIDMSRNYNYHLSKELWNLAFYFLSKAADLGEEDAWYELVSLYQKGNEYVQPDQEKVKFYKEKINEYWKRKK